MRRFFAVLILVVMAPMVAELLWGATLISRSASLISQVPLSGAGALWSIVFPSHLFDAADWDTRIFGTKGTCFLTAGLLSPAWDAPSNQRIVLLTVEQASTRWQPSAQRSQIGPLSTDLS
ncbi:hypothetical protein [Thermogemmatispora tikiterensis]|uniref:Uncharacterized protein n=1 Tax=Thermogemmatispora tikiterensis TaxID=1825093 RepID=A0A328VBI5_9CHLR|nr:hypothetical protein [Thermogemmatispora tikiterensis]RAQ94111.1 hypothetical protein A4R35_01110 [Thermogemmatispora tikiterensis]